MRSSNLSDQFYLSLVEFIATAKQQLIAVAGELGLTGMQAMTLLLTQETETRPMNTFCKLYNCDASNLTGIIDGLEQKGLVSRREHPKDRRIKVVHLEPAGLKLKATILRRMADASGFLFDPLTQDEADQLVRIIEKLAAHNKAANTL